MEVIFYSTSCPKCKVLKAKMNQKGIEYKEVNDVDFMLSKGIKSAPSIEIDGRIMDFSESVKWVGSK